MFLLLCLLFPFASFFELVCSEQRTDDSARAEGIRESVHWKGQMGDAILESISGFDIHRIVNIR